MRCKDRAWPTMHWSISHGHARMPDRSATWSLTPSSGFGWLVEIVSTPRPWTGTLGARGCLVGVEGSRNGGGEVAAESVEIKINMAGAVDAAIDALSLDDGEAREIYFAEDTTPGLASTHPLLAAGI